MVETSIKWMKLGCLAGGILMERIGAYTARGNFSLNSPKIERSNRFFCAIVITHID